jgi:2-polyprenyl-6-methoxyphenol hydroxylase-like FAD-dependent oxidoreductase
LVAGGGIGGLLAARVLSGHFERVTLIERDQRSPAPGPRKGVPQGRHVHVLLIRGQTILERLFPGLVDELRAEGAALLNGGHDLGWHHRGAWRARYQSDLFLLCMSRPLLEHKVADRVRSLPNVTVLADARVEGLRTNDAGAVSGLRVTVDGRVAEEIEADLVVDAMGRGSVTPRWISELGFAAPEAELLPAPVAYASCIFRRSGDWPEYRALLVTGAPAKRGGGLVPIEGDRWLATLISFFDEPSPQDRAAFLAYASSLATPEIYKTIEQCEPLSDIVRFRFAGSQRKRYDKLTRFPEGLIVVGDAVCSFNPVYGQGMTVSAIEAECLDKELTRAGRDGRIEPAFGRSWFRTIRSVIDAAWDGILLEDLRFHELADRRPARMKAMLWYMDRVHRATYRSPRAADQFYRVANFLDAPASLFRPAMLADAVFAGRKPHATDDPGKIG